MGNNFYLISLVICTYNRARYLPGSLNSIQLQTLDRKRFQIIIVDNASTDNTADIVNNFIKENPGLNIKYCFEENKGLSFARNRGMKESESEIISYVDDDVILPTDFLEKILIFFEQYPDAAGAGGKVVPKYESGKEPEWMSKYLLGFVGKVDYGNSIIKFEKKMKYPAGCNMIYKKEILEKAGGFNNQLKFRSDDKYIYYKVKSLSDKIYYLPDAWLYHYIDSHRLEIKNFKTLFLKTGNEEKKRLLSEKNKTGILKKFVEYIVKLTASFILYLIFFIKRKPEKGKYVVISQWCTLAGFLKKDVFVR